MRHILRRRELVADDWLHLGEEGAGARGDEAVIVPWAELKANPEKWHAYPGKLGVRLAPADPAEDLEAQLSRFSLVACEFPGPGEGRGYTQARLLRSRFQFKGEVRAVGAAVKQDLLFIMSRCGFDSFELAAGQKEAEALQALDRYSVAYQPAEPVPSIKQQRFFTADA
jgi:uncharacterized protein (DUF934 family)